MPDTELTANGWTAVSIDRRRLNKQCEQTNEPDLAMVEDIYFPCDMPLVRKTQLFAKQRLSAEAYNHSMRVYYWGTI
jgi:cyanamide hydratase